MRSVEDPRERALGNRRRVILELPQPLEPQVADTVEVVVVQIRGRDDLVDQFEPDIEEAIERRQSDGNRVHADLDVEVAANARHAIRDVERRLALAAFIEQSGGQRHQPVTVGRIDRRSAREQQHDRNDRHRAVANRAQLQTVRERPLVNAREVKRTICSGARQPGPIDGHETCTVTPSGSASSRRPRGTTLSVTDGALTSHRVTAAAAPRLVTSK
jgi:hypothetical protein